MNIEIPSVVGDLWHIKGVMAFRALLALIQGIDKTKDLGIASDPESLARGGKAQASADIAVEHPELAIRLDADEEEFADLVGGYRQTCAVLLEPGSEAA